MFKSLISHSVHIIINFFLITITERNAEMPFPGRCDSHCVCHRVTALWHELRVFICCSSVVYVVLCCKALVVQLKNRRRPYEPLVNQQVVTLSFHLPWLLHFSSDLTLTQVCVCRVPEAKYSTVNWPSDRFSTLLFLRWQLPGKDWISNSLCHHYINFCIFLYYTIHMYSISRLWNLLFHFRNIGYIG